MHENVHYFDTKIQKKILGRGTALPRPHPQWGGGHPLPLLTPLGASIIAPLGLGARPVAHRTEILATPLSALYQTDS